MRTLIVTPTHPPLRDTDSAGIYLRLGLFVRALARVSTSVEMLHYAPPSLLTEYPGGAGLSELASRFWGVRVEVRLCARAERRETAWTHYGAGIFSMRQQPKFFQFCGPEQVACLEDRLSTRPDVLFVHRLSSMGAVLGTRKTVPLTFFDLDDVEHRVLAREAMGRPTWPGKRLYLLQAPALALAEWQGGGRARRMYVCSELDERHLRRIGFGPSVTALPNAVPMPEQISADSDEPCVLLLGTYLYEPNAEAADRLITRIWPLIQREVQGARLVIAGQASERIPSYRRQPEGIDFPGFVPDLSTLYGQCQVVCCPIMNGGGTRVKLVEAAGYGKAMVSTAIGVEGLQFEDGVEILVRNDDAGLAEACVLLLKDRNLRERLGLAARKRALALYDARAIEQRIEAEIRTLAR